MSEYSITTWQQRCQDSLERSQERRANRKYTKTEFILLVFGLFVCFALVTLSIWIIFA